MKKTRLFFILFVLLALGRSTGAWELEGKNYSFEKIAGNVFVMHGPLVEPNKKNEGFMNNPALIVGQNGLIVVDPGSSLHVGKNILKEIEKISEKPIVAVFNSHIHGDHWLANQAIAEKYPNAKIYAHPEMIKQANGEQGVIWVDLMKSLTQKFAAGTTVRAPGIATKHGQIIVVDSEKFKIHNPTTKAHTDTDILIEHVNSSTLFLGDNAFVGRMGRFDNSSSIHGNIDVLRYANNLKNINRVVPGHGQTGNKKHALNPFLDYLLLVQKTVKKGYDDELEDYEIRPILLKTLENYKNWSGFNSNIGLQISKMYLEVENLD